MVILFFIFTNVMRNQFLVCKMHTDHVTNMMTNCQHLSMDTVGASFSFLPFPVPET